MEKIFFYSGNQEKKKIVRDQAALLGMEFSELKYEELGSCIGYLTGNLKKDKREKELPVFFNMPEILLFSGLPRDRMELFLDEFKKSGSEPVQLKAVVTPYNCNWSLYRLAEELKKEHEAYEKLSRRRN